MLANMYLSGLLKRNKWLPGRLKPQTLCALLPAVFFSITLTAQEQLTPSTTNNPNNHEQGRAIYNYRCYFCHGYSGDARTLASRYVNPPPRNFKQTEPASLSRQKMLDAVTDGKPGTAMTGFSRLLNNKEIQAVVDFVRLEFMQNKRPNTHYHTAENGWPGHRRYAPAFPFARGEIPLDTPWDQLSEQQAKGRQLFLSSCISCHDRPRINNKGEIWKKQSISYPRNNYSHTKIDAVSSASIYTQHDISPDTAPLSTAASAGKLLWLDNCAFCHGADGSGQNWIGSFLEPPPRDLRKASFMSNMSREMLSQRIENGLQNTSMPAWKSVLDKKQIDQIISYISETFYPLENALQKQ